MVERDGEEEGVSPGTRDVAHDVHAEPVPAGAEERGGPAQEAMAVEAEKIGPAGGRQEPAAAALGAASGPTAHPLAIAHGAAQAPVRLVCAHDVRAGE